MSFYAKYEILALLRDDAPSTGVKTFSARHLASGQTVGVHLLFENVPGQATAVLNRVRSLGPEQVSQVIEVGNHEGTSYVVTAQSSWPQSFDEWLGKPPAPAPPTKASADNYGKPGNWRVPASEFVLKSDPGAKPVSAATSIPEPGGFTRMFSISPRSAAGGEMATSSALHPSAIRPVPTQAPFVPVTPPPAPAAAPPSVVQPPTVPPAANPPSLVVPATPAASSDLTGETRKLEVSAVKPAAPPPAAGPGEFTRMFQVPAAAPVPAAPPSQDDLSVTKTTQIPVIPAVSAPPVPPPAPPPPTAPPPPVTTAPGEFTQMFLTMPHPATPSQVTPIAAAVAPAALPPVPAPGEFTQMFQTAAPAPAPTPSTVTPILNRGTMPPTPAPAPPAAAPGDFTNIFKTGLAPAQQPTPQPPPAAGPGEFTRIFQASTVRPTGEAPPVQQQPPPPPPPDSGPGEFTKFFQTPVESPAPRPHPALNDPFGKSAPPPTAPQSGGPGEFTQMFGVPSRPSQGGAPEPYKPTYSPSFAPPPSSSATGAFSTPSRPPSAPSMGGAPAGPGEYTQMFSTPSQPSTPPAPPAPPAAGTPNYVPLVIIFGVLFLIAAVLVVYFVMHR